MEIKNVIILHLLTNLKLTTLPIVVVNGLVYKTHTPLCGSKSEKEGGQKPLNFEKNYFIKIQNFIIRIKILFYLLLLLPKSVGEIYKFFPFPSTIWNSEKTSPLSRSIFTTGIVCVSYLNGKFTTTRGPLSTPLLLDKIGGELL